MADAAQAPRLAVFKALGDNTRYAIYLELARSPVPLTTTQIADALGLHANTVRPHLERMREVGLLQFDTEPTGSVGRPQHQYSLSPDAPSLGLEPPAYPTLVEGLLDAATMAGLSEDDVMTAGVKIGQSHARKATSTVALDALVAQLEEMGFDPAVDEDGDRATVAFTRCPYRSIAEAHPDLVCTLHRGMVEGMIGDYVDRDVEEFCNLAARTPCQVDLVRPAK